MSNSDTITGMNEKTLVTFKMSPSLKQKINDIAARENLTTTKLILLALVEKYPELNEEMLRN